MAAPLLIAKTTGAGNPEVFTMTGATTAKLGDDLPGSLETGSEAGTLLLNRVINAFGGVYACVDDGIYKLQTGSRDGEWSNLAIDGGLPYTNQETTDTTFQYGPYFIVIDGEPYLFGLYSSAHGLAGVRTWKINLRTGTSTISGNLNLGVNRGPIGTHILYNGILHLWNISSNVFHLVDPANTPPTISATTSTSMMGHEVEYDVFDNKLYATGRNSSTGYPGIYQFDAGNWFKVLDLFTTDVGDLNTRRRCLFNDGTSMYAIVPGATNWRMFQLDLIAGSLSITQELTGIVLPPSITSVNDGFWMTYQNQLSDGSTEILLYFGRSGSLSQYKFIDDTVALSLEDTGAFDKTNANWKFGGGDRIFESGAPTISVYDKIRTTGGQRVTFRVFPPVTGTIEGLDLNDLTVKFFFGTEQETPMTQALLTGTVTGGTALRNGNDVVGVSADGATDYTAVIQASGFGDNDKIELVAQVI
jgi:hypothetical protein